MWAIWAEMYGGDSTEIVDVMIETDARDFKAFPKRTIKCLDSVYK